MNEKTNKIVSDGSSLKSLRKAVVFRSALSLPVLGLMFFLPAGTIYYWQAWVYMLVLFVTMFIMVRYLYKNDPELLKRRMRMKEKQKTQKLVVGFSLVYFLPAFIIPGFDVRFGWSNVPLFAIIIADLLVLFGYLMMALVFKTNSYASRIIEVEKGQKVVMTGVYAIVRHPMYLAVIILFAFSPLALGSYWAMISVLLLIPLLVVRIKGEEKELLENLEGYKEYVMKTRYRLFPRIW